MQGWLLSVCFCYFEHSCRYRDYLSACLAYVLAIQQSIYLSGFSFTYMPATGVQLSTFHCHL